MDFLNIGAKIKGFGTKDTTWGLMESLELKDEADKIEIQDGNGDVVGLIYTNHRTAVSFSFNLKGNGTFNTTIGGELELPYEVDKKIKIIIDSLSKSYSRGAITGYSGEGVAYPKLTTETVTPEA